MGNLHRHLLEAGLLRAALRTRPSPALRRHTPTTARRSVRPPGGKLLFLAEKHHVGDGEPASRLENPEGLTDNRVLLRGEVDHTVADNDVDVPVRKRHVLDLTLQELRVLHASLGLVLPRQLEHLIGHVQTIGSPPGATRRAESKTSIPPPLPRSSTTSPGESVAKRHRVPTPQRSIGSELRQLTPLSLGVTPTDHIHLERRPLPRLRNPATRSAAPATRTAILSFPEHTPRRSSIPVPYSLLEIFFHDHLSHQEILIQV